MTSIVDALWGDLTQLEEGKMIAMDDARPNKDYDIAGGIKIRVLDL